MAKPINCDMCEAEPARMMQTDLNDGSTTAIGQNCLFVYFATAAQSLAPEVPPEPESEPEEKATRAPRKRAARTRTEPQPVDDTEPEPESEPEPPVTMDLDGNIIPF